ncbi:hypothetical protein JQS43_15625 [Natronosporangium hydrolyticum]|uniref:Uncharacterized protein n=1 Tax=Natronosporangium hydrolyticum TaxID=2811111 RepID=A0A895Y5T5_9ACTN|nr:hypothetical protein [Natronosporangium hydrolyticum]QSB13074.1 hypothetical protein JQS43_15625 [Natronosporangium hydrolyticum]
MNRRSGLRHPLLERMLHYAAQLRAWAGRTTRAGLAMRSLVGLTGALTVLFAAPPSRLGAALPLAAGLALVAAARPGGRWPLLLSLVSVGLVALQLSDGVGNPLLLVAPVAVLLYLHHSAAAVAAQLRPETVIPRAVFRQYAVRAGAVLAVATPVGLAVVALPAPATWSATAFLALGMVAAVGVTALLLRLVDRPAPDRPAPDHPTPDRPAPRP